jgi:geranylgeranyl pyrophosphate synthase
MSAVESLPVDWVVQHLPQVYSLLEDVLPISDLGGSYGQTLGAVLSATFTAEKTQPFPFTLLPLLVCQMGGGDPARAVPVAAAWRALHIAAKLLDDVEDGDVGPFSPANLDLPRVVNLATGYIAMSNMALGHLADDQDPTLWPAIQKDFGATILRMADGQHVDLDATAAPDLDAYMQLIEAKSGCFFALATRAGARCATADASILSVYSAFGHNLGILIQLADDLRELRAPLAQERPFQSRYTLPVVYGLTVASPPEQARLAGWLTRASAGDGEAAELARQLLISLGAEVYTQAEIVRFRRRAQAFCAHLESDGLGPLLQTLLALF